MARLVRAIHVFLHSSPSAKTWMTRIKRVMTNVFSHSVIAHSPKNPSTASLYARSPTVFMWSRFGTVKDSPLGIRSASGPGAPACTSASPATTSTGRVMRDKPSTGKGARTA